MKIPKSEYPTISTMLKCGLLHKDIAAKYGVSTKTIQRIYVHLKENGIIVDNETIDLSSLGKSVVIDMALRADKDVVKLQAGKALMELNTGVDTTTTTRSTTTVIEEIRSELNG